MNTMTADTLIEESRNSNAPKDFTLTRFSTRISTPKNVTEARTVESGEPERHVMTTATSSAPASGTVQAQ